MAALWGSPPTHPHPRTVEKGTRQQSQRGWGMGSLLLQPSGSQMLVPASLNKNATLGTHSCHLDTELCRPALRSLCGFSSGLRSSPPTLRPERHGNVTGPLPPNSQGIHPTPAVWKANSVAPGGVNRPRLAAVITAPWFLYRSSLMSTPSSDAEPRSRPPPLSQSQLLHLGQALATSLPACLFSVWLPG